MSLRDARFGSEADIRTAKRHVRFTPESDIKCDIWNARFGPSTDIPPLSNKRGSARQDNPDLGELARLCIDLNRAAVLLDNNVVAD